MASQHELIGDLPLIMGFCKRLHLSDVIDKHFITHGNHNGLSNGELVIAWIGHILSQGTHCKSPVAGWANSHKRLLQAFTGREISDTDFEDCRLGRLIDKFADDENWHEFEKSFYQDCFAVLKLDINAPKDFKKKLDIKNGITRTFKIDSTTTSGHHKIVENGIMQRGWSKDHRPELPQLKLMVSVEGKTGVAIASDAVSGNKSDDVLYLPIIERTRKITDTMNCLFCGDSKMSALAIRANIVKNKEFYLVPLQLNATEKKTLDQLVENIVNGTQEAQLIYAPDNLGDNKIIGAGYEITRMMSCDIHKKDKIEWKERVLLIRSTDHASQQIKKFEKELYIIQEKLSLLTSSPYQEEENQKEAKKELLEKISKLENHELFTYDIDIDFEEKTYARSEQRNGKIRKGAYIIKKYRAKIVNIKIKKNKVMDIKRKIGWRLYVTNASEEILTFVSAYRFYRTTMYVVEIGFHVLKDYLNIRPLFVTTEKQILGMTRLLTIALKMLTLITAEIRSTMKEQGIVLEGLYAGQPARKHVAPTAQSILQYFSRETIVLTESKVDEKLQWEITPLTRMYQQVLTLLKIPLEFYTEIPVRLNIMRSKQTLNE